MAGRYPGVRRFTVAVTAGAVLAAGSGGGAANASGAAAPGAAPGPGKAASRTSVTLVTGDKVVVDTFADGRRAYTATAGPGREKVTFIRSTRGAKVSVVPSDALGLLNRGVLDPRLFDIAGLISQGLDDAKSPVLPLIVKYEGGAGPAARGEVSRTAVPGKDLASIQAQAIDTPKNSAAQFWSSVTEAANSKAPDGNASGADAAKARSLDPGVARIWLDGRVAVSLERSVPQVGAPQAWQAGYTGAGALTAVLDTGIDATHADLRDAIADSADFTGDLTGPVDRHGHGTHVASIITGSGAASGGRYAGVAPDTRLLVGKVLGDDGYGWDSDIIAGMEWAAANNAKVVNMSLSGEATDGTDPMSEAVNALSASTGTLFVICAGNTPGTSTVGSPGVADAALTVGAVEADDRLTWFSAQGPRRGDNAVKPEITAPGGDIVAARAAGTSRGTPVDDNYTRLYGTSMAAPHVAGAAAILAQQHPDWNGARIKDALVGTAKPTPGTSVYAQGVGRLDVAAAVARTVTASPAALSAYVRWPHPAPVTRTVGYRNDGDTPLVLDLTVNLTSAGDGNGSGGNDADALVRLAAPRITVPAHGSADATLTIDPAAAAFGTYGGLLTATGPDGSVVTRTALGIYNEAEMYDVSVDAIDRDGRHLPDGYVQIVNLETGIQYGTTVVDGKFAARVPKGRYSIDTSIVTQPTSTRPLALALMAQPEVLVASDLSMTMDSRTAQLATYSLDRPRALVNMREMILTSMVAGLEWSQSFTEYEESTEFYATPTQPITSRPYSFRQLAFFTEQAVDPGRTPELAYNLAKSHEGAIPQDVSFRARVADLGIADVRLHRKADPAGDYSRGEMQRNAAFGGETNVTGYEHPVSAPGIWREYFSTGPAFEWAGQLHLDSMVEEAPRTRYTKGRTVVENWNKAPIGPRVQVGRCGDEAYVGTQPFTSPTKGHTLDWWAEETARLTLLRNGRELGSVDGTGGSFTGLSAKKADYTLKLTARRFDPGVVFGTSVDAQWTFGSTRPTGECDGSGDIPLLQARVDGNLDLDNTASARLPFPLTVGFDYSIPSAPDPRVREFTIEVSYDSGATWRRIPAVPFNGKFVALTPPAPAGHDGYASLRITARDDKGSTLTQTMPRAYGLRNS